MKQLQIMRYLAWKAHKPAQSLFVSQTLETTIQPPQSHEAHKEDLNFAEREWRRWNLTDYFIDVNIFIDALCQIPRFGKAVTDFIEKVELAEIKAIATPLVVGEGSYISLLQKGSLILDPWPAAWRLTKKPKNTDMRGITCWR